MSKAKKAKKLTEPKQALMLDDLQNFFQEFRFCVDLYKIPFFLYSTFPVTHKSAPTDGEFSESPSGMVAKNAGLV